MEYKAVCSVYGEQHIPVYHVIFMTATTDDTIRPDWLGRLILKNCEETLGKLQLDQVVIWLKFFQILLITFM